MRILSRLALAAALLAVGSWVYAVPIVYSGADPGAGAADSRPNSDAAAAAFDLAAAPFGLITFESAPLGPFSSLVVAPGVTLTGSDINNLNQNIINSPVCTDYLCGYNTTPSGSQWASAFGGSLTFTFASPITAFGAYISGLQVSGETFTFNDGSPQSVNIPSLNGGIAFVGFTNTSPFSSVTLNFVNDIVGVDDVRYSAAAAPVPEPATLVLLGSGLAGIALRRRKKA